MQGPEALQRPMMGALTPQQQFAMQFPAESAVGIINSGLARERIQAYHTNEAVQRIKQITDFMEQSIERPQGIRQRLNALQLPPQVEQTVEEILDRLVQHGPEEVGGEPNPLMVYMRQDGSGANTTYRVDARRIAQDKRYLEMLVGSMPPEQAEVIRSVIELLDTYGWQSDPHTMAYQQYNTMRADSPVNQATRSGARFLGVVGGGALAVLNGIISYRTGNASIAPFLYGALALYAANPNILEGRAMHVAREANDAVSALRQNNLAGQFGVQGTEWGRFAEEAMTGTTITPEIRQLLQRLQRGQPLTEEQMEQLNETLIPETASGEMRSSLFRMINSGRMLPFLSSLGRVRDTDAQELVQNYITQGAWRFGQPGV